MMVQTFFNTEFFLTKVFITLHSTTSKNQYCYLYREFKVNFDPDSGVLKGWLYHFPLLHSPSLLADAYPEDTVK